MGGYESERFVNIGISIKECKDNDCGLEKMKRVVRYFTLMYSTMKSSQLPVEKSTESILESSVQEELKELREKLRSHDKFFSRHPDICKCHGCDKPIMRTTDYHYICRGWYNRILCTVCASGGSWTRDTIVTKYRNSFSGYCKEDKNSLEK